MKRDIVIALTIGFFIGCATALTAVNLPNIIKGRLTLSSNKLSLVSPSPAVNIEKPNQLAISTPKDRSVSDEKTVSIEGKTKSGSVVLMESSLDSKAFEATGDGNFKNTMPLTDGANNIYVTSYDKNGESAAQKLTIFYTSQNL